MGLHCGPVIGGIVGVNLPRCGRPSLSASPPSISPRFKNVVCLEITALPSFTLARYRLFGDTVNTSARMVRALELGAQQSACWRTEC